MSGNEFAVYKHVQLVNDPEKLTLGNLISEVLFNPDISQSKLLNHNISQKKEIKYLHKFAIFVTLLIQLLLKYMTVPMQKLGSALEKLLNGFKTPESAGFFSFLGLFDKRLDLGKKIKHGAGRYNASLSIMATKIAYENEAVIQTAVSQHWKMEFVGFYNFYNEFQDKWTTQAFIFRDRTEDDDMIYVTFRGTSPFDADDWRTDFNMSWCKIKGLGKLHLGFTLALGLKKYGHEGGKLGDYFGYWPKQIEHDPKRPLAYYTIREKLKEIMANNPKAKFIVTGHSLGGALAILFPSILALHGERELLDKMEGVYTYGQPRVGDEKFGEFMKSKFNEHSIKYFRVVYAYDMVPTVPFENIMMMFKHFGTCIHFNSFYRGKIVEEKKPFNKGKEKNLIIKLWELLKWVLMTIINAIISRVNAVLELIRGFFFLPMADYREGLLTILVRIFAIVAPGVIDHFPRDYVNATRLCSDGLFQNYPQFAWGCNAC